MNNLDKFTIGAGQWTATPPTEPGWYWYRDDVAQSVAHLTDEPLWELAGVEVGFTSKEMLYQNGQWWSIRLEEPHDLV